MNRLQIRRLTVLVILVGIVSVGIVARLYQLQVSRHERFKARAENQHEIDFPVEATRGSILDRHGRVLAMSKRLHVVYAHPWKVDDPETTARTLAGVLDEPYVKLLKNLKSHEDFVYLKHFIDDETRQLVIDSGVAVNADSPVWFHRESKRVYPHERLAVHVIGYSGTDQEGVEGIEKSLDEVLQGDPTIIRVLRLGNRQLLRQSVEEPDHLSHDVILTIDLDLQHLVEMEIDRAIRTTGARSASIILLDPKRGDVLAMANRPTANLANYSKSSFEQRRNRAVTDNYEPGSTFKFVTMAAAFDRGLLDERELVFCENGLYIENGRRIHDITKRAYLTPQGVLENSSNIGISKIAQKLTDRQLHSAIRSFGFSQRTGIELPGEMFGSLAPVESWSGYTHSSLSFGQEVAVTALQMAAGFGVLASDGSYVPPRVVLATRNGDGDWDRTERPRPERVISAETAGKLQRMLEGVVANGTGKRARIDEYRLAGKSGTAQKTGKGGYSETDYVASFGGFGPVEDPQLVGLVVLNTPSGDDHQGGRVAAPVFGRIMRLALNHLRVPGSQAVRISALDDAQPESSRLVADRQAATPLPRADVVPDVRGYSLRDAIGHLSAVGVRTRVEGSGIVVAQNPAPGTALRPNMDCWLRLSRQTAGVQR